MKKVLILAAVAMMIVGCSKEVNGVYDDEGMSAKRVSFTVTGNWDSPVFTRAGLSANGSAMTDLWMFDYVDGVKVQEIHQSSTDADFGTPSVTLAYGQHSLYFVVSRGGNPSVSGNVITWEPVRDTFWRKMDVEVSGGSSSAYQVTMNRVVTKMKVSVMDAVPEGTAAVVVSPSTWYYGLDYLTGEPATARDGEGIEVSVPASYIGTTGTLAVNVFGFSSAAEWSTDVQVNARDADDDIIGSAMIAGAPFMANRSTEYSGSLFTSGSTFTITLNDEWDAPWTGTW